MRLEGNFVRLGSAEDATYRETWIAAHNPILVGGLRYAQRGLHEVEARLAGGFDHGQYVGLGLRVYQRPGRAGFSPYGIKHRRRRVENAEPKRWGYWEDARTRPGILRSNDASIAEHAHGLEANGGNPSAALGTKPGGSQAEGNRRAMRQADRSDQPVGRQDFQEGNRQRMVASWTTEALPQVEKRALRDWWPALGRCMVQQKSENARPTVLVGVCPCEAETPPHSRLG